MSDFIATQRLIDDMTENNITGYVNNRRIELGTVISNGSRVIFRTANGTEFISELHNKVSVYTRSSSGGYNYFNQGDTLQEAINSYFTGNSSTIIYFNTQVVTSEIKGVNDVYKVNPDDVRQLITDSFTSNDGQVTTDHSKKIIGLIKLPFAVPSDLIVTSQDIALGNYSTGITGDLLSTDELTVSLGDIYTPLDDNDVRDFINTTTIINLPYSQPINLDAQYVVGQTISIEYVVNLYDGMTTINLTSTKTNQVIVSNIIDLNASIPFGDVSSKPSKNSSDNVRMAVFNKIDRPFIEVISNETLLDDSMFSIPIIDECVIGQCSDFIQVEQINLKTLANSSEREAILSVLRDGIHL